MHMIRTAFVALTLFPQHGQTNFRVLDFFGSLSPSVPVPPSPALAPLDGGGVHPRPRFMSISVHPCMMMYSKSLSDGLVIVHP